MSNINPTKDLQALALFDPEIEPSSREQISSLPSAIAAMRPTSSSPAHPFQVDLIDPLKKSWNLLKSLRDASVEKRPEILAAMKALAQEMESFVSAFLEAGKKQAIDDDNKDECAADNSGPTIPIEMIVHDLRTPLMGVLGALDSFDKTLLDTLKDAYKNLYAIAKTLKQDRMPLVLIRRNFNLQRLSEYVGHQTRGCDSRVTVNFTMPDLVVYADFQKIAQVLVNLISNAVKYSPKPGIVTVNIEQAPLGDLGVLVRFQVSDNGPGMSEAIQRSLFQLYATGAAAEDTNMKSTGIGLYLSQQFIELMGGKIQVQSEVGKGSTFHFELRLAKEQVNQPITSPALFTPSPAPLSHRKLQVLVADDEQVLRKLYGRWLQEMDATIVESGETALGKILLGYDIVVLDQNMPGLSGLQTAEIIRKMGHKMPIIIVSGSEVGLRNLENIHYLAKPLAQGTLIDQINQHVRASLELFQNVG